MRYYFLDVLSTLLPLIALMFLYIYRKLAKKEPLSNICALKYLGKILVSITVFEVLIFAALILFFKYHELWMFWFNFIIFVVVLMGLHNPLTKGNGQKKTTMHLLSAISLLLLKIAGALLSVFFTHLAATIFVNKLGQTEGGLVGFVLGVVALTIIVCLFGNIGNKRRKKRAEEEHKAILKANGVRYCPECESTVKENEMFCPKCHHKM